MPSPTTSTAPPAVAARRVDITPRGAVTLGCSAGAGDTPVSRVAESLEAGVLAVESGDSAVVIVTLDSLYPVGEIRAAIRASNPTLADDHLLIAASHTHQAPMLIDDKPLLGLRSEEYAEWLRDKLAAEVSLVLADLRRTSTTARWQVHETLADHSINRRLPTRRGIRQAPNPGGSTDELVTVVVVRDAIGPVAAIWNYACHTVGHPDLLAVSAGFPHQVREGLRAHLGAPDLPVLYLQGFSGDVRPRCTTRINSPRALARTVRWGRSFHETTRRSYSAWCESLSATVRSAVGMGREVVPVPIACAETVVPLGQFILEGAPEESVRFQYIGLGPDLAIVAVSAELVTEYASVVRELARSSAHVLTVGCTDDSFGYIPTHDMLAEGGYEAGGFCRAFGHRGVQPTIAEATLNALRDTIPGAPTDSRSPVRPTPDPRRTT